MNTKIRITITYNIEMEMKILNQNMKKTCVILLSIIMALTVFTSCGTNTSADIDAAALSKILGEYQAVAVEDEDNFVGGWWHLSIRDEYSEEGSDFSIYDNEAGNPGVEGKIISIDDSNIVIKIDPDYYDQLPSYHWKDAGEYLEMTYTKTDDGIELTNNGYTVKFNEE